MARERGQLLFNTALLGAVFVVIADRLAKTWATQVTSSYSLIGDWLNFSFSKNAFVAFSLNTYVSPLIIIVPIFIIVLVYFFKALKNNQWHEAAALSFIIAGAASNLYDRILYGYVIDYLDLKYFTVFNAADALICAGVIGLLIRLMMTNKKAA